jgi:prepilin-type N-terminal cleavage/methylation domain-containing protein
MWNRTRRPRQPGFTLLELLVALSLLSLIVTLLYSGFAQVSGNAGRVTKELEARQELRVLLKLVADDLQAAQYLREWVQRKHPSGLIATRRFEEAKPFTWIRMHVGSTAKFYRNVAPGADPGLHEVSYRVERDLERDMLVLRRREDFYLDNDMEEGGITVDLADGIETFTVEFLVPRTAGTVDERWEEEWDSNEQTEGPRLPPAMRVFISRMATDGSVYAEQMEFNLLQSRMDQ